PGVRQFVHRALDNLAEAHDALIESRVVHTYYANNARRKEQPFQVGDKAYLSTDKLSMPKGRAHKLMPKYIGPYPVTESD
ncbi:hypothetical protein PLICRDRAFT_64143, partial [Plicaturopsis crispa FD-325 SS-3]